MCGNDPIIKFVTGKAVLKLELESYEQWVSSRLQLGYLSRWANKCIRQHQLANLCYLIKSRRGAISTRKLLLNLVNVYYTLWNNPGIKTKFILFRTLEINILSACTIHWG